LRRWKAVDPKELPPNPLNKFTSYELPDKLVVHLVDRPASAQAEIIVGNLSLARNHKDWIKLEVTNILLGGAADGRLFLDIREEKGLTYGIYSGVSQMQAPGTFRISTRTKTKTTGEMMKAIFEHVRKIREAEPEEKEFNTVVKKLVGKFPLGIETAGEVAGKVRTTLVYNLPDDYWKTYRDEVAAVTREDVKAAARKYIHPVPHVVIVGKAKKIEKQLKEVLPSAEIVLYDTELKPK
jgi:predicted Zn-dependent peptidase